MKNLLIALAVIVALIAADHLLLAGEVVFDQDVDFAQGVSFNLPLETGPHGVEMTTPAPLMLAWKVNAPNPDRSFDDHEFKPDEGTRRFFFTADQAGLYGIEIRGTLREYDARPTISGPSRLVVRKGDRRILARILQWF
jgi:hypothetical protein